MKFDITIHNPIDSNIQQNSKWPFPPFDLTNDWHLEPAMIPSCVTDTGQWDPGKEPLLMGVSTGIHEEIQKCWFYDSLRYNMYVYQYQMIL